MDNSIYITLSKQMAQFEDMAVTANNIANVSTPGYNAQKLTFSQYLVDGGSKTKDAYADDATAYRDTSGGAVSITNNPFDLAISGNGYFAVQTPLGNRYTKAGNFQLNAEGIVVNNMGYPVLGADGSQISIPTSAKKVEINATGQISADGSSSGQVGLFQFTNEQALKRRGNTLYEAQETPAPAATAHMIQGAIEASNVNGVTELTHVMEISRSVADTAKFIEVMYDLERKTSTTLTTTKTS